MIEGIWKDIRHALRTLRRAPVFAAVAVLSLALGIGANSAIFSVIDALLLRSLPVREPGQLVRIVNPILADFGFPYRQYELFRGVDQVFSSVAAIYPTQRVVAGASPLEVALVSAVYFPMLGITASAGRLLAPEDDVSGAPPAAVISYRCWEGRFGLAPDVLGRTIRLNRATFTVVGVAPRGFSGDSPGQLTDLWIPFAQQQQVMVERPGRRVPWVRVFARLGTGVTIERARAAAQVSYLQSVREMEGLSPQTRDSWLRRRVELEPAARGFSLARRAFTQPLVILLVLTGLVLLVACANLANLLLARSAARRREIATRLALGGSRGRIARQLVTESLVLAAAGGALGLLFARWGTDSLVRFAGSGLVPFALELRLDARVLGFTAALCLLTGLLFGVAPAWRTTSADWPPAHARTVGGRPASRPLIVLEVALSLVVLIAAGLFARSLANLKSQPLGFHGDRLLMVWTAPEQAGLRGRSVATLFASVPRRLESVPGVISASASMVGLLEGVYSDEGGPVTVPGFVPRPGERGGARPNVVAPGFFETVGMRLVEGRDFSAHDSETAPPVAVINQAMARYYFGRQIPLGRHLQFGRNNLVEIIGVVNDAKNNTLRESGMRMFYLSYRQFPSDLFSLCVVVRAAADSPAIRQRLREAIGAVAPELPIVKTGSVDEQIDQSLLQERLIALLASLFGALATALACIGVYGVMSYSAAQRTGEIGVRMALGATRADVLAMMLRESLGLVLAGVAVGIPAALALARLVSARLFGIRATDPLTVSLAAALMLAVGACAGLVPARRAARVDPMVALRHE